MAKESTIPGTGKERAGHSLAIQRSEANDLVRRGLALADKPTELSKVIRVLVVDDIAETRSKLVSYIEDDPELVMIGEARDGDEAVRLYQDLQPDVVSMNIHMPTMDGISATKIICGEGDGARVVMVSVDSRRENMMRSMFAGASDFLAKPVEASEYVKTLKIVGAGPRRKPIPK